MFDYTFPQGLKLATIIAKNKVDSRSEVNNFNPISTPVFAKPLEKVIKKRTFSIKMKFPFSFLVSMG